MTQSINFFNYFFLSFFFISIFILGAFLVSYLLKLRDTFKESLSEKEISEIDRMESREYHNKIVQVTKILYSQSNKRHNVEKEFQGFCPNCGLVVYSSDRKCSQCNRIIVK